MKNQLLTVNSVNPSAERKKIREERKRKREERNENKKSTPRSGNSSKCSDLKIISYWFLLNKENYRIIRKSIGLLDNYRITR